MHLKTIKLQETFDQWEGSTKAFGPNTLTITHRALFELALKQMFQREVAKAVGADIKRNRKAADRALCDRNFIKGNLFQSRPP